MALFVSAKQARSRKQSTKRNNKCSADSKCNDNLGATKISACCLYEIDDGLVGHKTMAKLVVAVV